MRDTRPFSRLTNPILSVLIALALIWALDQVFGRALAESQRGAASTRRDQEEQRWQGRVLEIEDDDLLMNVEGTPERFEVSSNADIRRNRRETELDQLVPRDFVTVTSIGSEGVEVAVKIRAFSAR